MFKNLLDTLWCTVYATIDVLLTSGGSWDESLTLLFIIIFIFMELLLVWVSVWMDEQRKTINSINRPFVTGLKDYPSQWHAEIKFMKVLTGKFLACWQGVRKSSIVFEEWNFVQNEFSSSNSGLMGFIFWPWAFYRNSSVCCIKREQDKGRGKIYYFLKKKFGGRRDFCREKKGAKTFFTKKIEGEDFFTKNKLKIQDLIFQKSHFWRS